MILVPYKAAHLRAMKAQEAQAHIAKYMSDEHAEALESTLAWSGLEGGFVIGCFGVFEKGPHIALLWSVLDQQAGRHLVSVHRAVKQYLEVTPYRRIEIDVDSDFEAGHRWARMLGFTLECERRKAYRLDGGDSALYAKVKHG